MKIDPTEDSHPLSTHASATLTEPEAEYSHYDHGPSLTQAQYIPLATLPLQAVDANYPKLLLIVSIAITLLITLVITIFGLINPDIPTSVTLSILPCYALLALIVIKLIHLKAKRIAYGVFEHELVLREGLFWVSTTALPYTRLQHVNLSQGPLERRYSLVTLKCFSAGSGVAEIDLPGLNADFAEHLRQHLLAKAANSHLSQTGDTITSLQDKTPSVQQAVTEHHGEDSAHG